MKRSAGLHRKARVLSLVLSSTSASLLSIYSYHVTLNKPIHTSTDVGAKNGIAFETPGPNTNTQGWLPRTALFA